MSQSFAVQDLLKAMQFLYPRLEEDREDDFRCEHPLTAVGVVLLTAAILGISDAGKLIHATRYSRDFISAILLNMQNNKLWTEGGYDASAWLSADGIINGDCLWEHIDIASGMLWLPVGDTNISVDPCKVFLGRKKILRALVIGRSTPTEAHRSNQGDRGTCHHPIRQNAILRRTRDFDFPIRQENAIHANVGLNGNHVVIN